MATDGDTDPSEDEMRPDEAAVLPERERLLDEADDDDLLTVDEAAEALGIDLE